MNWLDISHRIVMILIIGTWGTGFVFSRSKKNQVALAAAIVLGLFFALISTDLFFVARDMAGVQKVWSRGWIGPRDQNGAITIGLLEDVVGLTFAALAAFLGLFLSANRWLLQKEDSPALVYSGILLSVSGIAVSWLSLTPWLSILGLALVSMGGFMAYNAKTDQELVAQFIREKSYAFVLCFLGTAILAVGRPALLLGSAEATSTFEWGGSAVLLLGLFLHLQPFPLLTRLTKPAKVSASVHVQIGQLFPAIACMSIVARLEPSFKAADIFGVSGWIALAASVFSGFCGLAQENRKTAFPLLVSSSLSFIFSIFCFYGWSIALPLFLGALLSFTAASFLFDIYDGGVSKQRRIWFNVLLILVLGAGVGFPGFVSSGGIFKAMALLVEDPMRAAFLVVDLLIVQLLYFKCGLSALVFKTKENSKLEAWVPYISMTAIVLLSLGLLWSGVVSGGIVPHDPDRLFPSWLSLMIPGTGGERAEDASGLLGAAVGLYSAVVILPALIAYWMFARGTDKVLGAFAKAPRFHRFVLSGYSVDRFWSGITSIIQKVGGFLDEWLVSKISNDWIPKAANASLNGVSRWINESDRRGNDWGCDRVRQWVEVPAKTLRLIQNGDVQWYLFFAIGVTTAVLIHFLRA